MHGRNRAEHAAKSRDATFAAALSKKVANYTALVSAISSRRAKGDLTKETLALTGTLLSINPDYATLWNYRRDIIEDEGDVGTWDKESEVTKKCLMKNPKSYPAWFHRKWCVTKFSADVDKEVELTSEFLGLDERNFHCWNYRRYLIGLKLSPCPNHHSALSSAGFSLQIASPTSHHCSTPVSPEAALAILKSELDFTTSLINQNLSNYSAYHYRSRLLPLIHSITPDSTYLTFLQIVTSELDLVHQAVFTEPEDQSPWWYHRFLLTSSSPPPSSTMSEEKKRYCELLQSSTEPLRELVSEGSSSQKWPLNALHSILRSLDSLVGMGLGDDADEVLEVLRVIDSDKKPRYDEIRKGLDRDKAEVLFCFQERGGGDVFLEIKKGTPKEGQPKSECYSWFHISKAMPRRLKFLSWDKENGVRVFEGGALQVDAGGAGWVTATGLMELVKRRKHDVERDVVNACLEMW